MPGPQPTTAGFAAARPGEARAFPLVVLVAVLLPGALASPAAAQATLRSDLGGPAGYGTGVLPATDDGQSLSVDVRAAFRDGLCLFGRTDSRLFVNNNGSVSVGGAVGGFSTTPFPTTRVPMIAPLWTDVDTRGVAADTPPQGAQNRVYVDVRATGVVVTWANVGPFDSRVDVRNDFQLELRNVTSARDYDVVFRYARIQWLQADSKKVLGGTYKPVVVLKA